MIFQNEAPIVLSAEDHYNAFRVMNNTDDPFEILMLLVCSNDSVNIETNPYTQQDSNLFDFTRKYIMQIHAVLTLSSSNFYNGQCTAVCINGTDPNACADLTESTNTWAFFEQ